MFSWNMGVTLLLPLYFISYVYQCVCLDIECRAMVSLNSMFHLTPHTMRWQGIPEMLHLLLRSFPELMGSGSLISALFFSLESVGLSHKGYLLS